MAAYSQYLGATVTVQYRLGDILLSATGVLSADSGRSIFLEQHLEQRGKRNYFRWEIPYGHIHTIETKDTPEEQAGTEMTAEPKQARANAAAAGAGNPSTASSVILPMPGPPETA